MKLVGKHLHDVHQLVFLATQYPGHTAEKLGALYQIATIDINTTAWLAQDKGFIDIDKDTKIVTVKNTPEQWQFSDEVTNLMDTLQYAIARLNRQEEDLEENILSMWCIGYAGQDILTSMKYLLKTKVLATYDVKDTVEISLSKKAKGRGDKPPTRDETYTFFTLSENLDKRWGTKQFRDRSKVK